jgi:hypothetical protein
VLKESVESNAAPVLSTETRKCPMKKTRTPAPKDQVLYLVLWWQTQTPYAAVFDDEVAACAAASVRNALVIEVRGTRLKIDKVVDYYRRDDAGRPMPAEWREVAAPALLPWAPRPKPAFG